jgi:hypothetical protein
MDCVKQVRALSISAQERDTILGAGAAGLLGLRQAPVRRAAQGG